MATRAHAPDATGGLIRSRVVRRVRALRVHAAYDRTADNAPSSTPGTGRPTSSHSARRLLGTAV